ncbi:MAG: alpha/beta fold hydrolase [Blastomonas sp.]|uniref:alpha/beta fold hydrolase n=1 Tax=Blastomonas sp. TaxID=1909299 RepID=UPI0010F98308|nr:alpha/beta fold hydrolase [Blastomonas sp.]
MKAPTFDPVLQRVLDDPDHYLDRVRLDPEEFARSIFEEKRNFYLPLGAIPTLASVAIYVFRPDGTIISERRPAGVIDNLPFDELFEQLAPPDSGPRIQLLRWNDNLSLRAVRLTNSNALQVNLPLQTREALHSHSDSQLLLCANSMLGSKALSVSAESFGLTSLQTRVVCAVAWSGNGRTAGEELGLSYATVRETLGQAARKVGAPNLPALVRRVVESSFGVLPNHYGSAVELAEWLPLSPRQCQICELVAEGISRRGISSAMRVSLPVVNKELENIFAALEIDSAAALARTWAEALALMFFARATDGPLGFFDPTVEPTRYLPRADDHQIIAWSDYGPASGKPVLIVHSNWTCRAVPRRMVMRLQAAGWRPIAIDRPGFGKTHPGRISADNPYEQAVIDTANVLDRLKIQKIAVIARRVGHFVTILKQMLGDRIGPVLLTSPSSPTTDSGRRSGVVGVIKEAFFRSPKLIELYFRLVTPQLSLERMEKLTRDICKGSPPDEKLCNDPQFIHDRYRAIRPFATGNMEGAIIEEMQVSRGLFELEPLSAEDMMILHGVHDNHYSFEEMVAYWSEKWPSAEIRKVEDGGQFLTSSHPELLVDALEEILRLSSAKS